MISSIKEELEKEEIDILSFFLDLELELDRLKEWELCEFTI